MPWTCPLSVQGIVTYVESNRLESDVSTDESERLYRPDELSRPASGHAPQWVLDESRGRDPEQAVPQRHSTRRPIRTTLGVGLLLGPGVGAWASLTGRLPVSPGDAGRCRRGLGEFPTPGFEAADQPIGVPPSAVADDAYRFIEMQDDGNSPIAYDPCRPIHYVIRESGTPPNGTQLIASAVASVSTATGLQFVYDGTTTEAPASQRPPYQPERYGDRWAPVLFSWVTPEESPDVAGNVAGMAGSVHMSVAGSPHVYVTGSVELDAPQLSEHLYSGGGALLARAVIQHELGHLVGLDHVDDAGQLMYPETREGVTGFGAGDLAGLAALGSGPCVPQL